MAVDLLRKLLIFLPMHIHSFQFQYPNFTFWPSQKEKKMILGQLNFLQKKNFAKLKNIALTWPSQASARRQKKVLNYNSAEEIFFLSNK